MPLDDPAFQSECRVDGSLDLVEGKSRVTPRVVGRDTTARGAQESRGERVGVHTAAAARVGEQSRDTDSAGHGTEEEDRLEARAHLAVQKRVQVWDLRCRSMLLRLSEPRQAFVKPLCIARTVRIGLQCGKRVQKPASAMTGIALCGGDRPATEGRISVSTGRALDSSLKSRISRLLPCRVHLAR